MYAPVAETAPRATRRAWFGLAILALHADG
jgi:hypothetical protein